VFYLWLCFNVEWAAVSWRCKRQSVFALSSAEAEFIAASSMVQEVIFLCEFLDNLVFEQNGSTLIFADHETCIHQSEGSVGGSDRAKHIDFSKHFVHDAREQGILQLQKIDSEFNGPDLLTKTLCSLGAITSILWTTISVATGGLSQEAKHA
jgi:hypothetical protein